MRSQNFKGFGSIPQQDQFVPHNEVVEELSQKLGEFDYGSPPNNDEHEWREFTELPNGAKYKGQW